MSVRACDADSSYSGWLVKRGSVRRNWLRRYFILSNGRLEYYETPSDMQPKGVMSLYGAHLRFMPSSIKDNCMEISTNHRRLYVSADTSDLVQEWHLAIQKELDALRSRKAPPKWRDSNECEHCCKVFTFIRRKHHCRNCGGVFCHLDSFHQVPLPRYGFNQPVRVCARCYAARHSDEVSVDRSVFNSSSDDDDDDFNDDDDVVGEPLSPRDDPRRLGLVKEYSEADMSDTHFSQQGGQQGVTYVSVFGRAKRPQSVARPAPSSVAATPSDPPQPQAGESEDIGEDNDDEKEEEEEHSTEPTPESSAAPSRSMTSERVEQPSQPVSSTEDVKYILSLIAGNTVDDSTSETANMSMDEKLQLMRSGTEMWKLPAAVNFAAAKLTVCFIRPSDNGGWDLCWNSKKRGQSLPLYKCRLVVGQSGDPTWQKRKFQKRFSELAHLSFSLISPDRTLSLVCCDEEEFDVWLHVLQKVTLGDSDVVDDEDSSSSSSSKTPTTKENEDSGVQQQQKQQQEEQEAQQQQHENDAGEQTP